VVELVKAEDVLGKMVYAIANPDLRNTFGERRLGFCVVRPRSR
jgi:hypothetical protein